MSVFYSISRLVGGVEKYSWRWGCLVRHAAVFVSSRNAQTAAWETRECSKIEFAKIPLFYLYKLLELSGRSDTPPRMRNSNLEIRFADFSGRPQRLTALIPSFWYAYFKKLSNILGLTQTNLLQQRDIFHNTSRIKNTLFLYVRV